MPCSCVGSSSVSKLIWRGYSFLVVGRYIKFNFIVMCIQYTIKYEHKGHIVERFKSKYSFGVYLQALTGYASNLPHPAT